MTDFSPLYEELEYEYNDPELLKQALTHSSYVNDCGLKKTDCNERLEFLGDAVLGAIVGEILYHKYPKMNEGSLTKLRAKIVCERSLNDVAVRLDLGRYLYLSKGEITDNGRHKPSILSDAMEAVIGSMFLDGGVDAADTFIRKILNSTIESAVDSTFLEDTKSRLQKLLQQNGSVEIEYKVRDEIGVPHDKTFVMDVYCNGELLGTGQGKNKKEAEMEAAHDAIDKRVDDSVF